MENILSHVAFTIMDPDSQSYPETGAVSENISPKHFDQPVVQTGTIAEIGQLMDEYNTKDKASNIINPSVFKPDYLPVEVYLRPEISTVIKGVARYGSTGIAEHLVILGNVATGKTVLIKTICKTAEEKYRLRIFYINVRENSSIFKISCLIQGKSYKKEDRTSGLREVEKILDKQPSIIVLDEVDALRDLTFLYTISRHSRGMLILLTANREWYRQLSDQSVKSSLLAREIDFRDYNAADMIEILRRRVEEGLTHQQSDNPYNIAVIAKLTYQKGLDIRVAIRTLLLVAESDEWSSDQINKHLNEATRQVSGETFRNLTWPEQNVLVHLWRFKSIARAFEAISKLPERRRLSRPTFDIYVYRLKSKQIIAILGGRKSREAQILIEISHENIEEFEGTTL